MSGCGDTGHLASSRLAAYAAAPEATGEAYCLLQLSVSHQLLEQKARQISYDFGL